MDKEVLIILNRLNIFEAIKSIKYNFGSDYKNYISKELYFVICLKYIQEYRNLSKEDKSAEPHLENIKFLYHLVKCHRQLFNQVKKMEFTNYDNMIDTIRKLMIFA